MAGLLDIGPLVRVVEIRGKGIKVGGISGATFLQLLDEFPDLRRLMGGAGPEISPQQMLQQVPIAVAAIIAAATGTPGDKKAEEIAAQLSVGEQLELITTIWDLTFPKGVGSFIAALEALNRQVGAIGWAPDMPSPGQSSNSSPAATEPKTSGNTPPG